MNPAFNPQPSFAFCPEQSDMFTFTTEHGFCAVVFEEIQGFLADSDKESLAQFGSKVYVKSGNVFYHAVESVPELVARYSAMVKARATPAAEATTLSGATPIVEKQTTRSVSWK